MDDSAGSRDRTLGGWKEIASYVGKSVRAVQRWESDFGLPVRRIKTPTGQVVYAYPAEIDEWRRRSEPSAAAIGDPESPMPAARPALDLVHPLVTEPIGPVRHGLSPRRLARNSLVGTLGMIAIVSMAWAMSTIRAGTKVPSRFELRGDALEAMSGDGTVIWRHTFGRTTGRLRASDAGAIFEADVDGDERTEVLAKVHLLADAAHSGYTEVLFCFNRDGSLRWQYEPNLSLTFDGRRFDAPWRLYDVLVSTASERRYVWLSFGHHTWWPSALVRIDASGAATLMYVQSGAITVLAELKGPSGSDVVAGGVNNEYASASLSLVPADGAPIPSVSPQTKGSGYFYEGPGRRGAVPLLLLPRTEVSVLSGWSYNRVEKIAATNGVLTVETAEYELAGAVYSIAPGLRVTEADVYDNYIAMHGQLERSGAVNHVIQQCPRWPLPAQVRRWIPEVGWSVEPLPINSIKASNRPGSVLRR